MVKWYELLNNKVEFKVSNPENEKTLEEQPSEQ